MNRQKKSQNKNRNLFLVKRKSKYSRLLATWSMQYQIFSSNWNKDFQQTTNIQEKAKKIQLISHQQNSNNSSQRKSLKNYSSKKNNIKKVSLAYMQSSLTYKIKWSFAFNRIGKSPLPFKSQSTVLKLLPCALDSPILICWSSPAKIQTSSLKCLNSTKYSYNKWYLGWRINRLSQVHQRSQHASHQDHHELSLWKV